MPTSAKWILAAFTLVGFIAQFSILMDTAPLNGEAFQADLLQVEENVDQEFELTLIDDYEAGRIKYGTKTELYRFSLKSNGPYTLRYLTLAAETNAIQEEALHNNVEVYEVNKGKVDYTEPVGRGEKWANGEFRLRLFTPENGPYLGNKGSQEFLVTSTVLKEAKSAELATLFVYIPKEPIMDWAWLEGHLEGSWLSVDAETFLDLTNLH